MRLKANERQEGDEEEQLKHLLDSSEESDIIALILLFYVLKSFAGADGINVAQE